MYHTTEVPCIATTNYSDYKCMESYFAKQRGCQYPWNVYQDIGIPVCSNYATIAKMLKDRDFDHGYFREHFRFFERLDRTKMECPPPCKNTRYDVEIQDWQSWRRGSSLQIRLTDSLISHKHEYVGCDITCIIGEFGGNLGFFLGGSLLLGFNIILEYAIKALDMFHDICN